MDRGFKNYLTQPSRLSLAMSLRRKDSSAGHTGMTQEICDFDINDDNDNFEEKSEPKTAKIKPTSSKGFFLTVSRTCKEEKDSVALHAPQKTFFAVPSDASEHEISEVQKKINKVKKSYAANKYDVKVHEFELPFPVSVVGGLTTGYCNSAPKPLTVAEEKKSCKRPATGDAKEELEKAPEEKKKRARKA